MRLEVNVARFVIDVLATLVLIYVVCHTDQIAAFITRLIA